MEIKNDGREFRFDHRFNRCASGVESIEALLDKTLAFRKRTKLERHLNRYGQSSTAANKQLLQIIAGDVFHNLPARLHEASIGQAHLQADDVVAHGAIAEAARAALIRIKDFAQ